MNPKQQEQEYARVMGREALERQLEEAKRTCRHCFQRDGKHHPTCIELRRSRR